MTGTAAARPNDHRVTPDNRAGSYLRLDGTQDPTHVACSINRHQQAEPSVAVDPARPRVIAAATMDTCHAVRIPIGVAQAQSWMGFYRSTDRGKNWDASLLPGYPDDASGLGPDQECALQADPTLSFDMDGRLFLAGICFTNGYPTSLGTNDFHIGVAVFSDHGARLERVLRVDRRSSPEEESAFNADKPNLAVDQTDGAHAGNVYVAWTECAKPGLPCFVGEHHLAVARSTDHGRTFSPAVAVPSSPAAPQPTWTDIAIGPDGVVYIVFLSAETDTDKRAFWLTRSVDGGKTFSEPIHVASVSTFDSGEYSDQAFRFCGDGPFACEQGFTHPPFHDTATVAADEDGVHVVFSGRRANGQAQLFIRHSPDGVRWDGPPRMIAPERRGHRWHPDIASVDGALSVIFLDSSTDSAYSTERPPGNTAERTSSGRAVNTYAAMSRDGGRNWRTRRLTKVASEPNLETYMDARVPWLGDYLYASAVPGGAFGVWPDTRDVVKGIDERAGNNLDGFDVHAPCDWNPNTVSPVPVQPAPIVVDAYLSPSPKDPCLAQGGLDVNTYGARLPHGVIDLEVDRRRIPVAGPITYRLAATALRGGKREPVRGATLIFAGRRARTGQDGRARISVRAQQLPLQVRARKQGLLPDRMALRPVRRRPLPQGQSDCPLALRERGSARRC